MQSKDLPSLNAIRAFEATARHLSIRSAAAELCVTPGAVSQMIKILEDQLGVKMFERVNRGIFLTQAGRDYLPPVRNAFRQIAEASQRALISADTGILTVSATPFFASSWLVPRLESFRHNYPDIDIQILASNALVEFSRGDVDIAVRHGIGCYPGLRSYRIVSVEMIPVAAPAIVKRLGMPESLSALTRWPHVHDAGRKGWSLWFQAQGIDEVPLPRGPSYDDSGLLLDAVIAGQGAGLLPAAMVARDLEEGRLTQLASATRMESFAYYLVYPERAHDQSKITIFRNWMLSFLP